MPRTEESAIASWRKPGRGVRRHRVMQPVALAFAGAIWLGACVPTAAVAPAPLASQSAPITAEPPAGPIAPISVEPSSGPIALAPSMTGPALRAPTPALRPTPPPAATPAEPPPAPAPATVTSEPAPSAAAVEPPAAPSPCPPGQIATWSKPDMAGTAVLFCRRLRP